MHSWPAQMLVKDGRSEIMRIGRQEPQNLSLLFMNCIEGEVDWNEGIDLSGISLEVVDSAKEFATKLLAEEIDCVMPH